MLTGPVQFDQTRRVVELYCLELGGLKRLTGSFADGFLIFAVAGLACASVLATVSQAWQQEFDCNDALAAAETA